MSSTPALRSRPARRAVALLCCVALAALLAACTQEQGGPGTPTPDAPPALEGVWRPSGGGAALDLGEVTLTFLALGGGGREAVSGAGTLHGRATADIPVCDALIFAALSADTVAIYAVDALAVGGSVQLLLYDRPDADTLTLTNEDGVQQTFTRTDAVPAEDECSAATPRLEADGLELELASFANLLSDGVTLWVVGRDGSAYPVDLATDSLGGGTPLGSYEQAVTMQGASFWAHCGCGGSEDIKRVQLGGVELDAFDTATDLGQDIGIRVGAFDGTSLWLGGFADAGGFRLLRIDSDAEPDVLLGNVELQLRPQAIAALGSELWAVVTVVGPKLVRLDPATGGVSRVLDLPDPEGFGSYRGLAARGSELYLLVTANDGTFAIHSVTP